MGKEVSEHGLATIASFTFNIVLSTKPTRAPQDLLTYLVLFVNRRGVS